MNKASRASQAAPLHADAIDLLISLQPSDWSDRKTEINLFLA
jgi:hypothetical protein